MEDTGDDIYTVPWDGSSWGTARTVDTDAYGAYGDNRPFDVAFESGDSHGGHAVIAYSDGTNIRYRHTSDISGTWGSESDISTSYDCYWVQLEPNSDDIMHLGCMEADGPDDLVLYSWNNTSWTSEGSPTGDLNYDTNRTFQPFAISAAGPSTAAINLGQHDSSQAPDQFTTRSTYNDADLFRFQLTNTSASGVTVDELIFQLSSVSGIVTADLSDLQINNGLVYVTTGGSASISGSTGTIIFTGNFTVPASSSVDYTLTGDVANISASATDTLTISLNAADITTLTGDAGGPSPTNATHTAEQLGSRVFYTESGTLDDNIRAQGYSGGWTGETDVYDTSDAGEMRWHTSATNADDTEQVVLAASSSSSTLYGSIFDGGSWTTKSFDAINDITFRGFNTAYETVSGQLVVVQSTSTAAQLKYWVWNGSSWTVNGSTYSFSTVDKNIEWVRLAPHPETNQLALIATDADNDVVALVWDGDTNAWGNEKKLNSTVMHDDTDQIAVAYMQAGGNKGKALFVWARASDIHSWTWTGTAWETAAKTHSAGSNNIYWLSLAADPNSDDMLVAYWDTQNDIHTIDWTGAAWGADRTIETAGPGNYGDNRPFDIAFESAAGHAGHAVVVYSDTTGMRYQHTADITGIWGSETTLDGTDVCKWVELARDADGTLHAAAMSSAGTSLIMYEWDCSSWTDHGVIESSLMGYEAATFHAFTVTANTALSAPKNIYYSVGTSTADLKTGAPTMNISDGTATFSVAQTEDVGVGDVITYNTSSKAYIRSVTSPTTFTVQTATGATPADVTAATVNSIKRVFNTIATAESGSSGSSYLDTLDLVTGNYSLTWVCYNDGTFEVSSETQIDGWTTDAAHNITLTVAGASDVANGNSQRHNGIAGTGAAMEATGAGSFDLLNVDDPYTRIEWLEIDGGNVSNTSGIYVDSAADNSLLRYLVVHNVRGSGGNCISTANGSAGVEIYNVIGYDYDSDGIHVGGEATIYNSTLYLGNTNPASNSIQGDSNSYVVAYNVIGADPEGDFYSNNGQMWLYNCMSSDETANDWNGSGNLINKSTANQFVSTSGTIDLHLKAGSDAIDAALSLPTVLADDIDGDTRRASWDIGADEYRVANEGPVFRYLSAPVSVGPGTPNSWVDVDVSSYVPEGATGVILQVVSILSNEQYGVRKNGSTDTWMLDDDVAKNGAHAWLMSGLDSDRVFEVYTSDITVVTNLIGYTMDGAYFFTNAIDKSLTSTGSFEEIDISADTGSDTAIGAIFTVSNTDGGSAHAFALNKNGSDDDRYRDIRGGVATVALIGVDANEKAEMKIGNTAIDTYLIGYITRGAYFFTNALDKSETAEGTYEEVDITNDLQGSDTANGAILDNVNDDDTDRYLAVRRKGATYDTYEDTRHNWAITAVDSDNIFEQKIELDTHDLYLVGYTKGNPAGGGTQVDGSNVGDISGNNAIGNPGQRKLVRDNDGYWYAVWGAYVSSQYQIYMNKSTDTDGDSWSTPVKLVGTSGILRNIGNHLYYPSIDIDRVNDKLHLVWQENAGGSGQLFYSKLTDLANWNNATAWWSVQESYNGAQVVDGSHASASDASLAPSVAVAPSGGPLILFSKDPGGSMLPFIKYAQPLSDFNSILYLYGSFDRNFAHGSIDIDASGRAYVAAHRDTDNDIVYWTLDSPYTSKTGPTSLISPDGYDLKYTSTAADDEGNVHVVTLEETTNNIWSAYYDGSSWTVTEDADTGTWQNPDVGAKLGTGILDDVVIAPTTGSTPENLKYWVWAGSAWDQPETDTGENTDDYVSLERNSPANRTDMGYLYFEENGSSDKIHFARITGLQVGPVTSNDIMLGYAVDSDSDMYTSVWDGTTFPDGMAGPTFATETAWIVTRSNPARNEKIMAGLEENGASDSMYVSVLNGTTRTWGNQKSATVSTAAARCFDVAAEYGSGQVLVVANDNSTGLKYWVWDGSSWIVDGAAYPFSLGSGAVNWVRLASKPGNDEIAMAVLKDNSYVYGAVWNGATNTWSNQQNFTSTASATTTEAIAVEYINGGDNDGQAVLVWGKASDDCYYSRWTGSNWTSSSNVGIWTTAAWMTLASDPNSDKLALTVTSTGGSPSPVNIIVYSGSTWGSYSSVASTTNNTERQADAIFESASGHESDIVIIYADGSYGRYKHYDWNGSSYSMGTAQWFEHTINLRWMQLGRTVDGTIIVAGKDTDYDLNTWSWDNSSWTHENELATTMDSSGRQDFMLTAALSPGIGATRIYYSVGTNTAALYNDYAYADAGSLTLETSSASNIGVGDEVREGSNRYYITGRHSSTRFTIQDSAANGGTPGDTDISFSRSSISIYRAFNSLSAAEAGASNASHMAATDLAANGYQLHIACYADGEDTTAVTIDGYTTGAANYIRIFTPHAASQVGTSQRHNGIYSTSAYQLKVSDSFGIKFLDDHIRIEGLQIYVDSTDGFDDSGILITGTSGAAEDFRISHNILRGAGNSANTWCSGISHYGGSGSGNIRIWNNIIYDWGTASDNHGIEASQGSHTAYIYNNTIHSISGVGIRATNSARAFNNITQSCGDGYWFSFHGDSDYNLSDLAGDAPGSNSKNEVTVSFADADNDDFRLKGTDTAAKNAGSDRSTDTNLGFSNDIQGQSRSGGWDIGADEYSHTLATADTLIGWADSSDSNMHHSIWDGDDWSGDNGGPPLGTNINWMVTESSATYKVMAGADNTSGKLMVSLWDGSGWSAAKDMGTVWDDTYRCFDAAFETKSGQLVVVASTGTDLKYWVYHNGTWLVDGTTITGLSLGSQNKHFIELASDPTSNEIAMAFADRSSPGNAYGVIWDGETNAWGNEQLLESILGSNVDRQIDVAYMQSGTGAGEAMFVWWTYTPSNQIVSRIWNGSSWDDEIAGISYSNRSDIIRLRADPNSNKLVYAFHDWGGGMELNIWDGDSWGSASPWKTTVDSALAFDYVRDFDVIFETASGHEGDILVVYSESGALRYRHGDWSGSTYSWAGESDISTSQNGTWMQLERTADNDVVLGVARKSADWDLNSWSWNNISWSYEKELSGSLTQIHQEYKPWAITTYRGTQFGSDLTQAHYRWRNDDGGEGSGGGGSLTIGTPRSASDADTDTLDITNIEISGENRYLLVGLCYGPEGPPDSTTSVVLDPGGGSETSLTLLDNTSSTMENDARCELWGALSPPTGSNFTVRATLNQPTADQYYPIIGGAWPLSGVHQTVPRGTVVTSAANGSPSVTVSSAEDEIVFGTVFMEDGSVMQIQSPGLEDWEVHSDSIAAGAHSAGASSVTLDWTSSPSSDKYAAIAVSMKPAGDSGATWAANEDTKLTGLATNTTKRIRFAVSNEAAETTGNVTYQLQVAETATCSSGIYTAVPTDASGDFRVVDSSYITDGEATLNIQSGLTDDATGFVSGQLKDAGNTTVSISLAGDQFTEIEFAVQATDNATGSGDYCFRLYDTTGQTTLDTYTNYAQVKITGQDLTQTHYRWRNDDGAESGPGPDQATATTSTTEKPTSYEVVDSMTVTPGAGDFLVWYSSSLESDYGDETPTVAIYGNGSAVAHSERQFYAESSIPDMPIGMMTHAYISGLGASEDIDVRWMNTDSDNMTMHERTLVAYPVDSSDVWQASATSDTTVTPAASQAFTAINSMTLTPGAGDYLVWFSGSFKHTQIPTEQNVKLYVNGSAYDHTNRQVDQEDSLGDTYFPVALHAKVTGLQAGQAIDVRWNSDDTTASSMTMSERTLTLYKITAADATEVSATSDTTTDPSSYTTVNSMTINAPSDGNYLVWFSSSLEATSANDHQYVALFLNGSIVSHTEREFFMDDSLDNTYQSLPVALHAHLEGVTSGQTIDVRWKNYDTGSTGDITMHERTLVIYKIPSGNVATFALAEDARIGIEEEDPMRLRLQVSNEGELDAGSSAFQLQVAETATCSSGVYYPVGGTGGAGAHWEIVATSNIAEPEATSNVPGGLTDPSGGTFVAGELKDTGRHD